MGIYPDMTVEVLTKDPARGPCIVRTDRNRREIALKREMAEHIILETDY